MKNNHDDFLALKNVLENVHQPEQIDSHPWVESLFVQEAVAKMPALAQKSPGRQLATAVSRLFPRMMPSMPPKQGKRLDPRWGEFGLLAAQYFAPLDFDVPFPATMRDAWGQIDASILLFVQKKEGMLPIEEKIARYSLLSGELEEGPASTISDWHRRGLERLAEVIGREEQHLESQRSTHATNIQPEKPKRSSIWLWPAWLRLRLVVVLIVMSLLAVGGWRAWQVYQRVQSVRQHAEVLQMFSASSFEIEQIESTGQHLSALRTDMIALQREAEPFLALTPYLGWLPTYGGDLTQASALVEMGVQLSIAGDEVFQAVESILPEVIEDSNSVSIPELLNVLKNTDSQLLAAQVALSRARAARLQVQTEHISESTSTLLLNKIDAVLLAMQGAFPADEVLQMARLAPRLLGAVGSGSQTYLILIQNEDELRPTGGFISAVGRLVVDNGKITNLAFEGVSKIDDFSKPYPTSPWQLDEYMRSEILILRDSNWFTNFPTTVEWVEFLYTYSRSGSIDGVIAIDQHVVVEILRQIGPIRVEGVEEQITAENVMPYMHRAKLETTAPVGWEGEDWDRKEFINRMADPLIEKLLDHQEYSLPIFFQTLIQLLDERHILLQFDDPEMKELLARRGWNGAVQPPAKSDFLMVVDTNVGFNKTNLFVDSTLVYEVDLRDLTHPLANLLVSHTNHAQVDILCYQIPASVGIVIEDEYRANDCYWTYLRVYTPAGSELLASTPHAIRSGFTLGETYVPARTDFLGNENIFGVEVYGTLIVVSPGETLHTDFDLSLPQSVLEQDLQSLNWTYRLKVQKQPGTLAVPLTLRLLLPPGMQAIDSSHVFQKEEETWVLETDLRQGLDFFVDLAAAD